jgi:hypothetical protein
VVECLNRLVRQHAAPKYLFADNGAEFTGHLVDLWTCFVKVESSSNEKRSISWASRSAD